MIEIFKTNVTDNQSALHIVNQIQNKIEGAKVNFDLDDCDNILRVEHSSIDVKMISQIISEIGFFAILL